MGTVRFPDWPIHLRSIKVWHTGLRICYLRNGRRPVSYSCEGICLSLRNLKCFVTEEKCSCSITYPRSWATCGLPPLSRLQARLQQTWDRNGRHPCRTNGRALVGYRRFTLHAPFLRGSALTYFRPRLTIDRTVSTDIEEQMSACGAPIGPCAHLPSNGHRK